MHRRALTVIVLAGLALRLAFLIPAVGAPDRLDTADVDEYMAVARDPGAAYGDQSSPLFQLGLDRTPPHPALLWLALHLSGDSAVAAVTVVALAGTAAVALTGLLGRRLFGEEAGLVGAALVAVDPASLAWSGYAQPEALFTALLVASVLALTRATAAHRAAGWMVAAGLLAGLAAWTRPLGLYLPVALAALVAVVVRRPLAHRLALAGVLLAAAAVPVGAWTVRNHVGAGTAVLSTVEGRQLLYFRAAGTLAEAKGISVDEARARLFAEVNARAGPGAGRSERNRIERDLAVDTITDHPVAYAETAARAAANMLAGPGEAPLRLRLFGDEDGGGAMGTVVVVLALLPLLVLYAGLGLFLVTAGTVPWRAWMIPAVPAAYLLAVSASYGAYSRFRVPMTPFLAVLAGAGLWRVWSLRREQAAGAGR